MQRRSWMAALTLAALAGIPAGADETAQAKTGIEPASARPAHEPGSIKRKVSLNLRFSGLLYPGEVVIKPGNAGCRFQPITLPVRVNGPVPMDPIEIETFSADRTCSLVITLKEPRQPDKTMRRTFQFEATEPAKGPQVFECMLSAMPKTPAATVAERTTGATRPKK
ncbi:hypothetical protein TA3x_001223 [Tundrisphaera sp. TA3]|uniref:hypothetical protein n=1 Tax=Tundrisphaera sp. TA3 TaxID=3435775 RepID=UPI003EC0302C